MIYIKFEVPTTCKVEDNSNGIKRFLAKSTIGILKKIVPEANPNNT